MGFGQNAFGSHVDSTWLQCERFNSLTSTLERRRIFAVFFSPLAFRPFKMRALGSEIQGNKVILSLQRFSLSFYRS